MTAPPLLRALARGVATFAFLGFCAGSVWSGTGDQKTPPPPPEGQEGTHVTVRSPTIHVAPLQVDVNMVVVNVTVTDPFDRIVTGLDQVNFQVYDEKVEQKIVAF